MLHDNDSDDGLVAPRSYPDDREANATQLSFHEFCIKADQLYVHLQENTTTEADENQAAKEFFHFVLAGRTITQNNVNGHITLNACQGLPRNTQYEVSQDYDSLIGISRDLPYNNHLELTPVPPFKYTLKTDNHLLGLVISDVCLIPSSQKLHNTSFHVTYLNFSFTLGSLAQSTHAQDIQLRLRQGRQQISRSRLLSSNVPDEQH